MRVHQRQSICFTDKRQAQYERLRAKFPGLSEEFDTAAFDFMLIALLSAEICLHSPEDVL